MSKPSLSPRPHGVYRPVSQANDKQRGNDKMGIAVKEAPRLLGWRLARGGGWGVGGGVKGLHVLNQGDRQGFPERGDRTAETEGILIAGPCIAFPWARCCCKCFLYILPEFS